MAFEAKDPHGGFIESVHQSMFEVNPSRPISFEMVFERLGFSDPRSWCALYGVN